MNNSNSELNTWLDEYSKETDFSGIVEIISKGEVIFKKQMGYADRENKTEFTDDTRFKLYSMTKPLVAISVMKLYEEGKVDLNEHPKKYIDCAKNLDPAITVKMVMEHATGLQEIASVEDMSVNRRVDLSYEVEEISKKELMFEPGTSSFYCNTNYIILSLIAEKFYGMPIYEYLEKVLFNEMGMKSACCDVCLKEIQNMAVGYEKENDAVVIAGYINMALISGAGCAVGTIKDAECYYHTVRNKKILKRETWDLIFTKSDVSNFGLGCMVLNWNGKLAYQHNGGALGFRSMHRFLPNEDFAIILLSNAGYGNARFDIADKIHELYFGEGTSLNLPEMDKGFATK